jgi:transposase-like protein
MPWRTQTIMDERARFVFEAERSDLPFAELCRRYGISRPTGYKWVDRHRDDGVAGLEDRSHRPRSCPHATPAKIEKRIIELRKRRRWGAPKLRTPLEREFDSVPSVSTIHRILERHDLVRRRRPRRHSDRPGKTPFVADRPNALWTADFKGQFRTRDGELCYPLTVQDAHSRFLLDCRGLIRPTIEDTGPRLPPTLPHLRHPRPHPHRQWAALRLRGHPRAPEPALGLVDRARHRSVGRSTRSGLTRRSIRRRPQPATNPPSGATHPTLRPWSTPIISKCGWSLRSVGSGGSPGLSG